MLHALNLRFWEKITEKIVSTENWMLIWEPQTPRMVCFLEQLSQMIFRIPRKTKEKFGWIFRSALQ